MFSREHDVFVRHHFGFTNAKTFVGLCLSSKCCSHLVDTNTVDENKYLASFRAVRSMSHHIYNVLQ